MHPISLGGLLDNAALAWPLGLAAGIGLGVGATLWFRRRPSVPAPAGASEYDSLRDAADVAHILRTRSSLGVLLMDSEGRVTEGNEVASRVLGREWSADRPVRFQDMIAEADRHLFATDWSKLAAGATLNSEYALLRSDGVPVFVDFAAARLISGQILVILRDVTATRTTADSLRRAHRQISAALDAVPIPLAIVDRQSHVMEINRAWRDSQDRPGWPFPPLQFGATFDPSPLVKAEGADIARVIAGSQSTASAGLAPRGAAAPSLADWRLHATNAFDPGAGVAILLAERPGVHLEPDASDDRRFLAKILETTAALIVVLDLEGRIVRFNDACSRLTGFTPAEVLGKHYWDTVIPQDDREQVRAEFARIISTSETRPYENPWISKDGHQHTILWSNSVLTDPSGGVTHLISTGIDVTEARRFQQELVQAQRMEAIGQLAGGIAHEFNNLLTAIFGHTALAKRLIPTSHDAASSLDRVEQAAEQAGRVIRSLLTFSTKERSEKGVASVASLIEESAALIDGLIPANIQLNVLPVADTLWIQADRLQIQQAILNLAINARDAMPAGGILRLSAKAGPGGSTVEITLEDSGQGIPRELLHRVFEPFFTTKAKTSGGGLGLSVARSIAGDHGGNLTLISEPGIGTRVTLSLPLAAPPPAPASAIPQAASMRLLVASSRPYPRQIMVSSLGTLGVAIEPIGDIDTLAKQISAASSSDIVICDAALFSQQPALAKVAADRALPVLVFGDPAALAGLEGATLTTLAEPFTTTQLLHATRRIIEHRQEAAASANA